MMVMMKDGAIKIIENTLLRRRLELRNQETCKLVNNKIESNKI